MSDMMTSGISVDPLREEQDALEFQRRIGRNVRYWRMKRALTAEEFARRSGKPVATINEIESGEAMPGIEFLWRAAQVLKVSCLVFTEPGQLRSAA
jgi:transcriptional regulator with XRE-family HTH domain